MARLHWALLASMAVLAAGGRTASAERLGGSYRGPGGPADRERDAGPSGGGGGPSGGSGSTSDGSGGRGSDGGGTGGETGSGGTGGVDGGGGGGGSGGGSGGRKRYQSDVGEVPVPSGDGGGGGGGGGGGDPGGPDAGGSSEGGGDDGDGGRRGGGSSSGGSTGGGRSRRAPKNADDGVACYFERNREHLIGTAVRARDSRLRRGMLGMTGEGPWDTRVRSALTESDRARLRALFVANASAKEDVVRDAAAVALGKDGSAESVRTLLARLSAERSPEVREDVVLALGIARTPEAVEALVATARGADAHLRTFAVLALGSTRDERAAGPVVLDVFRSSLKEGGAAEELAAAAAVSLGALKHAEAGPALVEAVQAKSTPELVKVHAVRALGAVATADARRCLAALVGSREPVDVRRAAVLALGDVPDAGAARLLEGNDGLRSADGLTASFAALSLADAAPRLDDAGRADAVAQVREAALADRRNPLRSQYANLAAGTCVGAMDEDADALLRRATRPGRGATPDVAASIALACGVAARDGADPALSEIAASNSEDPALRGYAALSLAMSTVQLARTAEKLRTLADESDDVEVRRGAVLGLGLVGDRKDVAFLARVLARADRGVSLDSGPRGAAVAALGLIRDGGSLDRVEPLLGHSDPVVRALAIAALGSIADKDETPALTKLFERSNFVREFPALRVAMRTL